MACLTVVCENTAGPVPGILGEHGFSVLIERSGGTILFDTGQGRTIMHNLACLKKDPGRINRIALSHGHYDHTGGLEQVLRVCSPVDVCCHPGALRERFVAVPCGSRTTYRRAGIPFARSSLEALGARFVFNTGFTEIGKDLYLTGEVPRTTPFEKNDSRLKVKKGARYVLDTIPDDQSLVIDSKKGLVVVLGCAHAGIINTLKYITSQLPGRKVHTIIGGTHIGFLGKKQLDATIDHLQQFRLQRLGVSHCTGLAPAMYLMQAFGGRFFFANAGCALSVQ
jgi:7,8-dihydropterin-6-yl-methyl-4-(beta-D-ribofuranosyl)aminobenzene 5'-phosphate synthase